MGARPAAPPARPDRGDPLTATDDDPYLRWQVPPDAVLERWDDPDGVALLQQGRQGVPVLTVVGTPATAFRLAPAALEAHDVHLTTLPRGAVEALDRHRLLSDITKVLADEKVNILSASVQTSRDRVAVSRFSFEMGDPKHLGHLLRAVRNVEGVYDVYRVTSAT